MSKTQIQTLVVLLLLVAFVGIWFTTKKSSLKLMEPASRLEPAGRLEPARAASPAPSAAEDPPTPVEDPPQSEAANPPEEISVRRDPYAPPPLLKEVLEQRERQRQQDLGQRAHGWTPTPQETPVQMPSLILQGIFWGIPKPQAIINRKIVSVGDTVEGSEVVAVTREGVTVSYNGEEHELKLPQLGLKEGNSIE